MLSIELTFIPSTIYKGSEFPLEPAPLILTFAPEPGEPEEETTVTPETLPCNTCSTRGLDEFSISLESKLPIAPVTKLFFLTPYPTTTTCSKTSDSSTRTTSTTDLPATLISLVP